MKEITLDCSCFSGAKEFHDAIAKALSFPGWYGGTLDALYDCLTSLSHETQLTLLKFSSLGEFAQKLYRVLEDAVRDDPRLQITIHL